jgi:outer membrane protein TolC
MKKHLVFLLVALLSSSLAAMLAAQSPIKDAVANANSISSDRADSDAFERLLMAGLEKDPRAASIAHSYRSVRASARETEAKRLLDLSATGSYSYKIPDKSVEVDPVFPEPKDSGAVSSKASAAVLGPLGSSLSADLSYSLSHDDEDHSDSLGAGLTLSLPILVNGMLVDPRLSPAAKRLAVDSPLEGAVMGEKSDRCSFVLALMRQILEYAQLRRTAALSEQEAGIDQRDLEIARVKYSGGTISFKELREAESQAESSRLASIADRVSFKNLARKLEMSTGIPSNEIEGMPISCPADSSVFSADAYGKAEDGLSVLQALRDLKDAEAARIVGGAQSAPRLNLTGGYSWQLGDTALEEGDAKDKGPFTLSAGLSLDLGFTAAARRKEAAKAKAEAAARKLDTARAQAAADYGDACAKADAAKAQAEYLSTTVDSARARLAELEVSFRAGTALSVDVDRADLALERAKASLEGKRAEYFLALTEIYGLKGMDGTALLADISAAKAR